MKKVSDIMTAGARCIGPDASLVDAARLMRDLDVGSIPVCDNDRLAGILTDRDIAIRAVAKSCDPDETKVRDAMSPGIVYAFADQNVDDAARLMEQHQIRRLPILDRNKRLIGILSLGDLALGTGPSLSGEALTEISQSAPPPPA